jgi:[ribosomal protein S5]-alanine N-acetyltransferase
MILDLRRLPILETERLRLEPLAEGDAAHLFPIMHDPELVAYWDVLEDDDPEFVAGVIRGQVEDMAAGKAIHWSMRPLAAARYVGCFSLLDIDRLHRRAAVGFLFGRGSADEGYPAEALGTVLAFAAASGLRKLSAHTYLGARRSEEVLESLGFVEEGLLRGHILKEGERRDCRVFGLLL